MKLHPSFFLKVFLLLLTLPLLWVMFLLGAIFMAAKNAFISGGEAWDTLMTNSIDEITKATGGHHGPLE